MLPESSDSPLLEFLNEFYFENELPIATLLLVLLVLREYLYSSFDPMFVVNTFTEFLFKGDPFVWLLVVVVAASSTSLVSFPF